MPCERHSPHGRDRRDAAPWNGLADRRLGDNVKTSVPGIGPVLARRLLEELEIATLEDLEVSAWGSRAAYNRDRIGRGAARGAGGTRA